MNKTKKLLALTCCAGVIFSGCNTKDVSKDENFKFEGYPIKTENKLSYWADLNTAISTVVDNMGKTEFAKKLQEETGVEIEYIHPAVGQEDTSLSLLIASDQLPDIVETSWYEYSGGASKAIKEEVIRPLNDLIDNNAPNLKKYLTENKDIDRMVKTDEGEYYVFPFIRGDKRLLISVGTLIRQDWLDELGLKMPETVADMENVLTEFKNKKGAKSPLSFTAGNRIVFLGNFSTSTGFYLENGKVVYGPLTENYKFAVETLRDWCEKDLLDPNFVSIDSAGLNANVLNGETGITINTGGGGLGTWLDTTKGEKFEMVGMPFTAVDADTPVSYYRVETPYPGYGSAAITTSCKNPALAARWLDYGYGEKGNILNNFGTKGISYEKKDGRYVYTDEIFNNPDGLSMAQAMGKYFRSSLKGPFVQSKDYIDQFYYRPEQQKTLDAWLKEYDKVALNTMPKTVMTSSEAKEFSNIMAEVEKYESKMFANFVLGTDSLDKYAQFIDKMKGLNIERAVEIQQNALDRYNNR